MLVNAQAGQARHVARVIGIVEGARGRVVGQSRLVQVVVGAGHLRVGARVALELHQVEAHRLDGHRILRGEQARRPVAVEGRRIPDHRLAIIGMAAGVQAVDQVEQGVST